MSGTDDETVAEVVRADWVVAADGANSAVRQLLGIESADSGFEADWLVVDYRPLVDREWDAFVTQHCDPAQPATAVKSGPGRRRFEFMRRDDMSLDELGRAETAWQLMKPWDVTPDNAVLERHAVYTFRGRWATRVEPRAASSWRATRPTSCRPSWARDSAPDSATHAPSPGGSCSSSRASPTVRCWTPTVPSAGSTSA